MLKQAQDLNQEFPIELANSFVELSRLAKEIGDLQTAERYKEQAIEIYKKCGAMARIALLSSE